MENSDDEFLQLFFDQRCLKGFLAHLDIGAKEIWPIVT